MPSTGVLGAPGRAGRSSILCGVPRSWIVPAILLQAALWGHSGEPVIGTGKVRAVLGAPLEYSIIADNSPTSFGVSELPPGLSLNATTGSISGTPRSTGTYEVTVTASNNYDEATAPMTIMIAEGVILSDTSARAALGAQFKYQIVADNSPASYEASELPSGLSLNNKTGLISGVPRQIGTNEVTISASNTYGVATGTLTIGISAGAIVSLPTLRGVQGGSFKYQIFADNDPRSFAASELPLGLSLNGTSGVISGIPRVIGTNTVTVRASNTYGTATGTITIVIAGGDIGGLALVLGAQGAFLKYQISADNDPTSFEASGLPTGLSLDRATGSISGVPRSIGVWEVVLTASNRYGTASGAVTMAITGGDITSDKSVLGAKGGQFKYAIIADNRPTAFAASELPSGLSLNRVTGLISGMPRASGIYPVTVSASNTYGTATASITITITDGGITSLMSVTAVQGAPFGYQITADNSPTSFGASGLPLGLTLNRNSGLISGVPRFEGASIVTATASNAYAVATATLTITVLRGVITSVTTARGVRGAPFAYQISADNRPTSFDASGLPLGLSVNHRTGLISGRPPAEGTSIVTVTASNTYGTASAPVAIEVTGGTILVDLTAPLPPQGRVGEAFSYQIIATGDPTSYGATNLPAGLSLNAATGLISGIPEEAGTTVATLSATNGAGSGSAQVTFLIAEAGLTKLQAARTATGVLVEWAAQPGYEYRLKRSTDLVRWVDDEQSPMATVGDARHGLAAGRVSAALTEPPPGGDAAPAMFYKVEARKLPPPR